MACTGSTSTSSHCLNMKISYWLENCCEQPGVHAGSPFQCRAGVSTVGLVLPPPWMESSWITRPLQTEKADRSFTKTCYRGSFGKVVSRSSMQILALCACGSSKHWRFWHCCACGASRYLIQISIISRNVVHLGTQQTVNSRIVVHPKT